MTDKEIIKALECCANNGDCKECAINPHKGNYGYCTSLAIKAALDLINRQQAEIERLEKLAKDRADVNFEKIVGVVDRASADIKAEAIKECLEKIEQIDISESDDYIMVKKNRFDKLVKEMVGDAE